MKKLMTAVCLLAAMSILPLSAVCAGAESLPDIEIEEYSDHEPEITIADDCVYYSEAEEEEETLSPSFSTDEDLFAGYADSVFGADSGISFFSSVAGDNLTGQNAKIYSYVKEKIKLIADGETNSSEIVIPFSEILDKDTFTEDELGISLYDEETGKFTDVSAVRTAFKEKICKYSARTVVNTLFRDVPFDFYWYDKTDGTKSASATGFRVYLSEDGTPCAAITSTSYLKLSFSVSQDYSAGKMYTLDTEKTGAALKAKANADKYAAAALSLETDYDKILYFAKTIKSLSGYNYSAAYGTNYGDPWQLIWVFDEDPDTKVVCEGFAKAFQYLCDRCSELGGFSDSFYSYMVTGTMNKEGHMWNIVHMDDGNNYLVDITNCVLTDNGIDSKLFLCGYESGDYFNGYSFAGNYGTLLYKYDNNTLESYFDTDLEVSAEPYEAGDYAYFTFTGINGEMTENIDAVFDSIPLVFDSESGRWKSSSKLLYGHTYTLTAKDESGICSNLTLSLTFDRENRKFSLQLECAHSLTETVSAKNADCTHEGYTGDTVCSYCGILLAEGETAAVLPHTAEASKENEISPSCTSEGSYDLVTSCSVCGKLISSEHVTTAPTGHTAGEAVKSDIIAPTCTEKGSYTLTTSCSVCGKLISSEHVTTAPTGHTAGKAVKSDIIAPTCTKKGSYTLTTSCSVCGETLTKEVIAVEASGHKFKKPVFTWVTSHRKCTAAFTCSECSYSVKIKAAVSSKTIKSAGYTYKGKTRYTASLTFGGKKYTSRVTETDIPMKKLAAPSVSLKNTDSGICVSWKKVKGASAYAVYRNGRLIKRTSSLKFTDKAVKTRDGVSFTYKVVAYTKSLSVNKSASSSKKITRRYNLYPGVDWGSIYGCG